MHWFYVALCDRWPPPTSSYFPEYIGMIEACSAFAAIEIFMRLCELAYVAYADAFALDGSLHYRGHKVLLATKKERKG